METEYTKWYGISEKRIKIENLTLWENISNWFELDIPFKEKFYLYINNIKEVPKCRECNNPVNFIDMLKGWRQFCSKRCMIDCKETKEKRKSTNLQKWGVDNPSKSNLIKKKVRETNREKFGYDFPLQNPEILNETKNKFIEKWGVDNPSKVEEIKEKRESTFKNKWGGHPAKSEIVKQKVKSYFLEKFGVENPILLDSIKEKINNTNLERFGGHPMKLDYFKEKSKKRNLEKWGEEFYTKTDHHKEKLKIITFENNKNKIDNSNYKLIECLDTEYVIFCNNCESKFNIQRQLYLKRERVNEEICINCNKVTKSTYKSEKEIYSWIDEIYKGEVLENKKIDGKELDIYIPEFNLGIEFNGLYWHSEFQKTKNYHLDKKIHFQKLNISLFQIWEDDWLYKKEIIKEMIKNRIRLSDKIWARKCDIRVIDDNKLVRDFLEKNHIQGFVGSSIKIGLYNDGNLVSLMTFGKFRISMGQKSGEGEWELLRFCNLSGKSVVGGASKILNYFISNFNPNKIITYSLNSYSDGNLYEKIGFNFISETGVNYFWCKDKVRNYRFNFRKDKLVSMGYDPNKTEAEIMREIGYFKVWDAGSKKWELTC
jgi:endogenous inhibitor of DNA gyrase (YacG/DUF329 family)